MTMPLVFLREHFAQATSNSGKGERYRACYPEIILISHTFGAPDSRLSYGHVSATRNLFNHCIKTATL